MNQIKKLRQAHIPKMSQKKLGNLVGVGRSTVAMWESGKSEPDNATLIRLSAIFNVSINYILGCAESEKKPTPENEGGLNEMEQAFIHYVRDLTPGQREMLFAQMQVMKEAQKKAPLPVAQD